MDNVKKIGVLGCTGSVGMQTLDVNKKASRKDLRFIRLRRIQDTKRLLSLANEFCVQVLVITGKCDENYVRSNINAATRVYFGKENIFAACDGADTVLLSIMGIAALPAFEYCLKNGIPVALASKEAMVCGGSVARALMDKTKTPVYPVDSELSAIFQCLRGNEKRDVERILLTASEDLSGLRQRKKLSLLQRNRRLSILIGAWGKK